MLLLVISLILHYDVCYTPKFTTYMYLRVPSHDPRFGLAVHSASDRLDHNRALPAARFPCGSARLAPSISPISHQNSPETACNAQIQQIYFQTPSTKDGQQSLTKN